MKVLVLNCGSSSLKFRIIAFPPAGSYRQLCRGIVRRIGQDASYEFEATGTLQYTGKASTPDHKDAVGRVLSWLAATPDQEGAGNLADGISGVGHRVVHGGSSFTGPVPIDAQVVEEIESLAVLAPLHNPPSLHGIRAARELLGPAMPMVAVFDTAFHHTIPEHAATYALPYDLSEKHRIRRYGFHGTAHRFLAIRYGELTGTPIEEVTVITLQLGNGCSATAVRAGKSVDTSMGFTPLEGLVMGTRSGDLDPALVSFLCRQEGVGPGGIDSLLNERSGLLGISGRSSDMERLIELSLRPEETRARLAIGIYCYRVRKYIGAYLNVLNGAPAVVFSGGIGENAPEVRRLICEGMEWCGLVLDHGRNSTVTGREGRISADGSRMQAWVVPSDEELLIAEDTRRILEGLPGNSRDCPDRPSSGA